MEIQRVAHAIGLAAGLLLLIVPQMGLATPIEVGGGGGKSTDCLTTFKAEVNTPSANPRHVYCTDGDSNCDADQTVNGVCNIQLRVCANSTFSTSCMLNGVDSIEVEHAQDDGIDPKFDPNFQALQTRVDSDIDLSGTANSQLADQCTSLATISVPIKGPLGSQDACGPAMKKVKLTTVSKILSGATKRDVDVIKLKCYPVTPCDPGTLFGGTADRIQRQVYNQSCAVATCHDSETHQKMLVLESGASLTNTVNVIPQNSFAIGAGWKRIAVSVPGTVGEPDSSYLYHKIVGDLPDASYGVRMPYRRPKLNSRLIEIMRLWILAGAPPTGWVPGTD
jgi:hypothetical protein